MILFVLPHILVAEDYDAAAAEGGGAAAKRQRLEALAGSDVASAYPDTSVQFDAAPALDHSSAVAAIAEAYAPVSRDKAAADQEKREAAEAAAKAAQAAAAAKRQREAAINQVSNPQPVFPSCAASLSLRRAFAASRDVDAGAGAVQA